MDSRPSEQLSQNMPDETAGRLPADVSISGPPEPSLPSLRPISVQRVPSAGLNRPGAPQWILFNDISVSPASALEVTQLYGVRKIPCLLYYTQVICAHLCRQIPKHLRESGRAFEMLLHVALLCNPMLHCISTQPCIPLTCIPTVGAQPCAFR